MRWHHDRDSIRLRERDRESDADNVSHAKDEREHTQESDSETDRSPDTDRDSEFARNPDPEHDSDSNPDHGFIIILPPIHDLLLCCHIDTLALQSTILLLACYSLGGLTCYTLTTGR